MIFEFFLRPEVVIKENLKKLKGPLIVVSIHASWIDPFLIGAVFPRGAKIFPIRYACWWKYYYFPLFFPFVLLFGAFPIRKGFALGEALKAPLKILKKGGVVGFFPEGKRRRGGRPRKGRRGAAYLALKARAPILPIKIEGNMDMGIIKFCLREHRIRIKIGRSFRLPFQKIDKPEDLNQPSDLIMQKVREL